jgi:tRNA pseudouridine55 synthase
MGRKGLRLDGVVLLDKPSGISSNAALQRVKHLLGAAKAGHTGTLDPLATGLLPLCFGEATKFAAGLLDADKDYEALVQLGSATSTGDSEGEVIFRGEPIAVAERIGEILIGLTGSQQQTPPMFSALKHQGRPLYEYARSGQTIERTSRQVVIHELTLLSASDDVLELRVRVSKGTYIRTLAETIGDRLGCGAHLKALRRTRVGSFNLAQSVRLDQLEGLAASDRLGWLQRPDLLLDGLPRIDLDAADAAAISQGRAVQTSSTQPPGMEGLVRLYDSAGGFLGLGAILVESGEVIPKRLVSSFAGGA